MKFQVGTRVKLNEAYAIVGDLGYWPNGNVVKVAELLEGERLRVSLDAMGQSSRIVGRSSALAEDRPGASFAGQFESYLGLESEIEFVLAHAPPGRTWWIDRQRLLVRGELAGCAAAMPRFPPRPERQAPWVPRHDRAAETF